MRKIYFVLLITTIAFSCMAQNVGEAFYIYRNDGQFNAFFRDEVLSIEYSNYDLDSVYHDDVLVQDVYTEDSVYRIPLAAIDSVGFHTPVPIFQSDVKIMDSEWVPYIINVQDSLIVFSKNIPAMLCPHMGDVLVTEYPNTDFPLPFSGRVIKIENTTTELKCVCKDVEIAEIYKKLIFIGKTITESNSSSRLYSHKRASGITPVTIDRNKLNKKITIDDIDDFKFSLELDPQVELQYYMLIDEDARSIYRVKASTKTSLQLEMDIVLDTPENKPKDSFFRKQEEISNILKKYKIPVEFPILTGVTGFIELRPILELNAEVSAGLGWSFTLSTIDDVYKDKNGNIRHKSIKKEFSPQPPAVQASLSGDVFGGLGIKLGLGGIKKNFSSVGVDVKTGFVLNGDAHFSFSPFDDYDTTIYDAFKESKISLNGRIEAIPFFTVLKYDSENSSNVFKFSMDFEIGSWNFFPEFNNLVYNMKGNTLNIQIDASKRLLLPAKVGIVIFDDVENVVDEYYQDYPYWLFSQLFQEEKLQLEHNFNIKAGKKYKCYPVVQLKWGDHYFGKIKASPNADIENIFPVAIADYEQTSAQYSKAAFTHKGANYDFCYSASVTASITSTNNVEDWGYVYEDLNGDTAHVSLKAFESPYTDTRYSYYRNEPESYATLYGYVKYVGDDNFCHGEKTDYPLIYDKQPEAITLEPTMIEETSAKVMCKYKEAAPWGGTCGVEYWEDLNINNTKKIYFDTAEEEIEITLTDLKPGTDYYYQAFIMIGDEYIMDETEDGIKLFTTKLEQPQLNLCPDNNHPHLIDLGLPSGTKWACCNVGASKPEEYGEYYMYGQVKNAPSIEQFRELINKCSYQWINYNGINGNLFIGSNGQSIFMPAGGKYFNTGQLGLLYVGEFGVYWSSSPWIEEGVLNTDKMASPFEFSEQHVAADCWDMREDGLSVRSVDSGIKVKTGDATDINTTSTTLNGTVENLELATESVTLAFLYSTSENILNSSDCKTVEVANDSEGNLTTQISDLHDYTTYYYAAAYKLGDADYVLGEVKSFTTSVNVTTIDNPEVTITSATLQGICSKGVTVAGFFVKMDGDTEYTQYNAYPDENGNFSATINGLDIETQYVYYAYAQVNEQFYEGEEYSFTTKSLCPDDHHPHMIDLGLPSGTKWACCNVGASKPDDYGGYYAWGETIEKEYYSYSNYLHRDKNVFTPLTYHNIGSDIGGTQYDVAHTIWGENWRMPSLEQQEELTKECTSKGTTINGVEGSIVCGPNGSAIFLPAAGGHMHELEGESRVNYLGTKGWYWSSIQSQEPLDALTMDLWEGGQIVAWSSSNYRDFGLSVRPVQNGMKITTGEATDINTTSATLNGTVENIELATESVTLAFLYSTSEDIINSSDYKTVVVTNDDEGNLTTTISDLSDNTSYYYAAAYKLGDADYVLGEIKSFTTINEDVNVTTIENPEVTINSATLQGFCSTEVNNVGFFVKMDGEAEYTQYEAYSDESGNFSATIDGLGLETQYVYYAYAQVNEQFYEGEEYSFTTKSLCPDDHHPHMIDLGLPSGTKWACCNVGATKPEGYGNYYAWGETTTKSYYDWTNYKYGTGEDGRPEYPDNTDFTKYCNNSEYGLNGFCDGKITLEPNDDAATVNWGDKWRMPLMKEQQELVENCEWFKVSLSGINGRLAIGSNGNAIFLPAAGFKYNYYPNDTGEPGSYGNYWSASIDTTVPANSCQAADMNFQDTQYYYMIEWRYYRGSRCAGESVRPVAK